MFGDVQSYFAQGDAALYAVLLGLVVPWVVARVSQVHWNGAVKLSLTAAFSVLAALGDLYFNGQLNANRWQGTALVVAVAATVFYKGAFKSTADRLEVKTSKPAPAARPVVVAEPKPQFAANGSAVVGVRDVTDGE